MLHGAFATMLGVVAALASATALGTSGPWFGAAVSTQVYSISLLGAIVLSAFLVSMAGSRAGRLDEIVRSLDLRLAGLPEAMRLPEDHEPSPGDVDLLPPSDAEIDDFMNRIESVPTEGGVEEFEVAGTLVDVSTAITSAKTRREVLKEVIRQRGDALAAHARIMESVAAPLVGCLTFAIVAGTMLPGAESFATTHPQLNTAAVLFLAYGWTCLIAWALVGVGLLGARAPSKRSQPSAPGIPETMAEGVEGETVPPATGRRFPSRRSRRAGEAGRPIPRRQLKRRPE